MMWRFFMIEVSIFHFILALVAYSFWIWGFINWHYMEKVERLRDKLRIATEENRRQHELLDELEPHVTLQTS